MIDHQLFTELSWVACALTAITLLVQCWLHPESIIRPSFIATVSLHLLTQWGAAYTSAETVLKLHNPWDYFIVVQIFPLCCALFCNVICRDTARDLVARIKGTSIEELNGVPSLKWLSLFIVGTLCAYLGVVAFSQTGLYGLFAHVPDAALMREQSMKLLSSRSLKYLFTVTSFTVCPVAASLCAFAIIRAIRRREFLDIIPFLMIFSLILFTVSISGARSPAAIILLNVCAGFFLLNLKRGIRPKYVIISFVLVLIIPTLFSLLSHRMGLTWGNLVFQFTNVLERVFLRTISNAVWHVKYVEQFGTVGFQGLGNVVSVFGVEPVNVYNQVGSIYVGRLASVSANTSMPVSYYTLFGLYAVAPCILGVLLLDFALNLIRALPNNLMIPCLAGTLVASTWVQSTWLTTMLFTFGFLSIPLLGVVLAYVNSFAPHTRGKLKLTLVGEPAKSILPTSLGPNLNRR